MHAYLYTPLVLLLFNQHHQVWLSCLAINYRVRTHPNCVAVLHGGADQNRSDNGNVRL